MNRNREGGRRPRNPHPPDPEQKVPMLKDGRTHWPGLRLREGSGSELQSAASSSWTAVTSEQTGELNHPHWLFRALLFGGPRTECRQHGSREAQCQLVGWSSSRVCSRAPFLAFGIDRVVGGSR